MDPRVFISYSSLDKAVASTICRAIEGRGHPCWIASRDVHPGDNFQESIVQAIRECRVMVLVFSKNANGSREIQKELALAGQFERLVIPVRVEDVQPSDAFRFELATRQWVDIFEDWEHAIERLVKRIEAIGPGEPKELPIVRPEPRPLDSDGPLSGDIKRQNGSDDRKKSSPATLFAGVVLLLLVAAVSAFYALKTPDKKDDVAMVAQAALSGNAAAGTTSPTRPDTQLAATKPVELPKQAEVASEQASKPQPVAGTGSKPSVEVPVTIEKTTQPAISSQTAVSSQLANSSQPAHAAEDKPPLGPPGSPAAAGSRFRECADCPEMVVIPAGRFMMGSPPAEIGRSASEGPLRQVLISAPVAVGLFAVTFAEWDACVAEGGCEHYTPGDSGWGRGQMPVIFVSWRQAQAYVQWLSMKTKARYRLLSEAEWEYAARGCSEKACASQPFWVGARLGPSDANFDWSKSVDGSLTATPLRRTVAVDWGRPNAFGLFNMVGNVRQWVEDCWRADYAGLSPDNAPVMAPGCQSHVVRGGSWSDDPRALRSAARNWETIDQRSRQIGFRVARQLD